MFVCGCVKFRYSLLFVYVFLCHVELPVKIKSSVVFWHSEFV